MKTITTFDNTAEGWERSLYAFLAEKERRGGCMAMARAINEPRGHTSS